MLTSNSEAELHSDGRPLTGVFAILIAAVVSVHSAFADQLLYVYSPDCGACMKFDREVGGIYAKTEEAIQLPIVKVDLEQWRAGNHPLHQCDTQSVFATPTFIHLHECSEVDRITGYSTDELFWFALERMNNRAKAHGTLPKE